MTRAGSPDARVAQLEMRGGELWAVNAPDGARRSKEATQRYILPGVLCDTKTKRPVIG
jgi:hypothetical protein